MTDLSNLLIIEYGIEEFAGDYPHLTEDQLKQALDTVSCDMDYSYIDEYIQCEFSHVVEKMFSDKEDEE